MKGEHSFDGASKKKKHRRRHGRWAGSRFWVRSREKSHVRGVAGANFDKPLTDHIKKVLSISRRRRRAKSRAAEIDSIIMWTKRE
jgi:hypothetical protein